jgi:SRSO17 transposase
VFRRAGLFPITAAQKNKPSTKVKSHVRRQLLAGLSRQFLSFHERYHKFFQRHTVNLTDRAEQYLKGLFQADKKNMERMEERVVGTQYDPLQYFLSDSNWDWRPLNDQTARDGDRLLGGRDDSALYLDESALPKKGKKSVGVARQWCGQLGKIDNCQVAVFATLGRGNFSIPIDCRLYLPEEWTKDRKRCEKAKIPPDQIVFKTKHEQALEMVFHARKNGIRFKWVGFDGFYGDNPAFLRQLDNHGEVFVGDIHKDHLIYFENPKPIIPPALSNRGKKPGKLQAQTRSIRVDKWIQKQALGAWKRIAIRDSTKGKIFVDILHRVVWLWDGKEAEARRWHLVVRREIASPEKIKYSLSNAPFDTPTERLAFMQSQRYWVERPFQDAKNQCGMGDYQARGWQAWHHHMSMVMLAMLFLLEQRLAHQAEIPLLSCADVATLLKSVLPKKDITGDEVLRQLEVRHRKRQASIDFAYRKQREEGGLPSET